ncbi:hypothetical protein P5V15_002472 [Pogonomyrmex californicus]
MAKIHELHFELVDHPPFSPDLAPSDFFLFPKFKISLGGQRFSSNEEVIAYVKRLFCGARRQLLFEGVKEVRVSMGKVYRLRRRLC